MKKLVILLIIFSILACKEEKVVLNMDKEILVSVLADMHVAEEMIGKFREEDKDSVKQLYMHEIVELHDIDTTMLFSEIRLLQDNPELGLEIYGDVYTRLEKYSKSYDKSNKNKEDNVKGVPEENNKDEKDK